MPTATMTTRDSQRQRVYDAEQLVRRIFDRADKAEATYGPSARSVQLHGSTITLPIERRFGDLAGVQRYVDAVLALNWVQARWSRASGQVTCRLRSGDRFAHYETLGSVIAIPSEKRSGRWAMRELVVLHEIAHHLAPFGDRHGPAFAETFVDLVGGVIGAEAAFVLRAAMHDTDVRVG